MAERQMARPDPFSLFFSSSFSPLTNLSALILSFVFVRVMFGRGQVLPFAIPLFLNDRSGVFLAGLLKDASFR